MGLGSYFKATTKSEAKPTTAKGPSPAPRAQASAISEKQTAIAGPSNVMELQPPSPRFHSRPQSITGRSMRSTRSSVFVDDIKHEVMVNYLYQQQCSQLWVSDGCGEVEGVLLRKSRGHYMACPPQLGTSPFALACTALNVQVSNSL